MGINKVIQFKHVIIEAKGPENPHIKAVGDINGNGFIDVVIASGNGGPLVWYEAPNWTKHVIVPSGKWSCDAKIVDMDGDGDLDILISEWYTHNRLEWYENPCPDGDPGVHPWKRHIIGSPRAHNIEVGDIDGDGQLEIITRSQSAFGEDEGNKIIIWKRNADTWTQRVISCPSGEGLTIRDIDNDGNPEVVIGGRWYETPRDILNGVWQEHIFAEWPLDAAVQVADMNKNGRLDVVLTRSEGHHRLSWFEAPPDPKSSNWTEHIVENDIDFAHSLKVCDMDNDGNLDIVTAEMHQSSRKRVMVYFNTGNAMRWRRQMISTSGSHNICVADIKGNGNLDIIGANWSGSYQPIEMWENLSRGKKRAKNRAGRR